MERNGFKNERYKNYKKDRELIKNAKAFVNEEEVDYGIIREVGCALVTKIGKIFTGVSLHLGSGLGFCAEHTAIANMVSHSKETEIQTIVVCDNNSILYPCGRCRELIQAINRKNR